MMIKILLSRNVALIWFFLEMFENSKEHPKVKIRRLELPNLSKFPIELGFPRIQKLQKIEHELKVIIMR